MPLKIDRRQFVAGAAGFAASAVAAPRVARAAGFPINIVSTQGNATLTLQELMRRKGYLQEFGVEATNTNVVDGSKLMGSLLSGENDICVFSGFGQVLTAIEKGAKLKIVAGAMVKPEHAFYTKRAEIKSVKDLPGKTIASGSVGALLHSMTIDLLRKYGVDEKSVKFVNVGSASDVFRAVAAGTVDAGISEIDVYDQQAKYGVHVLTEGDMWKEIPEYTFQASYVSDRAIVAKREGLVRTLAAFAKLYRYLSTDASQQDFIEAQTAALGRTDVAASTWQWKFFRDYGIYATDLVLAQSRVDYLQKLNLSLEVQTRLVPYEECCDMSLARDAIKLLEGK